MEFVKLLHRHVLLGTRECRRDVAIEAIGENALRLFGTWRVTSDDLIERGFRVEHEGPQLTLHLEPRAAELPLVDLRRFVGQFLETERGCQPLGRIDRQHSHFLAVQGSLQCDGRGRRRLTNATRARAHDYLFVGHDLADGAHPGMSGAHSDSICSSITSARVSMSGRARPAENRKGSSMTGCVTPLRSFPRCGDWIPRRTFKKWA